VTFSIVVFSERRLTPRLAALNEKITHGLSIGEAFKKSGHDLVRKIISDFIIGKPGMFREDSEFTTGQLAEIYFRYPGKDDEFYAEVCEVYPPSFRSQGPPRAANRRKLQRIAKLLAKGGLVSNTLTLMQ
jgi:hypothetical protein